MEERKPTVRPVRVPRRPDPLHPTPTPKIHPSAPLPTPVVPVLTEYRPMKAEIPDISARPIFKDAVLPAGVCPPPFAKAN